jgi:hypothetical protein
VVVSTGLDSHVRYLFNTGTKIILFYAFEVLLTAFIRDLRDTFNCIHVTNLSLEINTPIDTHLHSHPPPTHNRI